MKLSESYTYPAAVEDVYELITDASFRESGCEAQGSTDYDVDVVADGGGHTVTIKRTMPADDMPEFVKKLTGNSVKVVQTEAWGPADSTGGRSADVKVEILGQPARMNGTATINGSGDATEFVVDGDVKVSIPLVGKKIEPVVAKAIVRALETDVELGTARL